MINLSYAGVNPEKEEGEITLSATFRKEESLNRVDIIEDWIKALNHQMKKAANDIVDPDFEITAFNPSRFTAVKLCADLSNSQGSIVYPRWFGKAPPITRMAYLRDWERILIQTRKQSVEEWKTELNEIAAEFRKKRIRENRVAGISVG